MYRMCLDCNNGQGLRLPAGEVTCPEDHGSVVCLFEVGDVIGDFRVEEMLPAGEGGYATVYRALPLVASSGIGKPYPKEVAVKVALSHRRGAIEREAEVLV